jgi:hypothetical protein
MPLTSKGRKIKSAMIQRYGKRRGARIFYASRNKGTITGVDERHRARRRNPLNPVSEMFIAAIPTAIGIVIGTIVSTILVEFIMKGSNSSSSGSGSPALPPTTVTPLSPPTAPNYDAGGGASSF